MEEKLQEQMLLAMVGVTALTGEGVGFLAQGMCIPLAATPKLFEVIKIIGEDAIGDWIIDSTARIIHNVEPAPKSGGLWVFECTLDTDGVDAYEKKEIDAYDIDIASWTWRQPTKDEIGALLQRSEERSKSIETKASNFGEHLSIFSRWVYVGALV